ncbi:MAG: 4-hydroxy-tetrahydrodipicolinate synthase [Pyrinomonadaceae bacterium]|nr:4-hydroxy-tetrahydrodipicolinate synthase [Pyrinomonadaceae bacterium]
MLELDWIRGCATALITPFTKSGEVDVPRLRALAERQIAGGVRLLVPCGTTGESATMTEEEDRLVIKITVEVVHSSSGTKNPARVIAGVGSNSTVSAIEYAQSARDLGADALLTVAPYYNKPTQDGLFAHFRAIAEAVSDVPVVIYNVPGRTACNITAATTLRLAREVENIVAVKEASGNMSQIMAILHERPTGFRVLSGDDALCFPLLALGADGVISVVSNEAPDLMSQMVEAAFTGEWEIARTLHYRLLPLMEANFIETSPGPVKAALALMGLIEENFRLPLVPVTEQTRTTMRNTLERIGLLQGTKHVIAA